jgi:hypothetical protein
MPKPPANKALLAALWVNAALLAVLIGAVLTRTSGPTLISPAMGQSPTNIGGGAGIYIMPAQFTATKWGCYMVDVDRQTLAAYEYDLGDSQLTLKAARSFRYDLQLGNYDTFPSPDDIKKLVEGQTPGGTEPGAAQPAPGAPTSGAPAPGAPAPMPAPK